MMHASRKQGAILLVLVAALWGGCQTVGARDSGGSGAAADSAGYVLLHDLCKKQSSAGQAFLIVSAHDQTKQTVRNVADLSKQMAKTIEAYAQDAAPQLDLDAQVLPEAESRARDRIESDTRKAILMGGQSERSLILAQIDATAYAAALAEVLAKDTETEPMRDALSAFADAMHQQNDALAGLLVVQPGQADGKE